MGRIAQFIIIISVLVSFSALFVKHAAAENPELKKLYDELMEFKDDPEFHEVGFAECCKYNKWKSRVEALRDGHRLKTMTEKVVAVDLLMLAVGYKNTEGEENEYTRETKKLIVESFD